jgi:hypothetical protein
LTSGARRYSSEKTRADDKMVAYVIELHRRRRKRIAGLQHCFAHLLRGLLRHRRLPPENFEQLRRSFV